MAMRTGSAGITTINRANSAHRKAPKPEFNVPGLGALFLPLQLRNYSCKAGPNQLKSAAEPVASQNGPYVAYAPVS